jgi:hypothetical protein
MRLRRLLAVAVALAVVLPLAAVAAGSAPSLADQHQRAGVGAAGPSSGEQPGAVGARQEAPCTGTVTQPADGWTVVSVQGARGGEKKAARLLAFGPEGEVTFVHPYADGIVWGYDVDPMPDGNLFVTGTFREGGDGDTRVWELDPETGERVWSEEFDALDTHDADLVEKNSIAVANMRNYHEEPGVNRDRLFVYNRTSDEVTQQWVFDDHYPESVGGDYEDDWTHVNDVEHLGGDRYVLSPRNFDQVVIVDAESGEIVDRLGSNGDYDVLRKQHNPDYLRGPGGESTILVGDSENDRVVEYASRDGEWNRTWSVGEGQFAWPRDADRLPNGNTLITDSRNHRVVEVTPEGEVVWEVYTPWLPYDAERIGTGDESSGPTVADQNASGDRELTGSAGVHESEAGLEACAEHLGSFPRSTAEEWPPAGADGSPTGGEGSPEDTVTWVGGDETPTEPGLVPGVPTPLLVGGVLAVLVAVGLAARSRL